jgi:hypothetical protein
MFWLQHCWSNATALWSLVIAEDDASASSWIHDEDTTVCNDVLESTGHRQGEFTTHGYE